MNIAGVIACLYVAVDCAMKAMGAESQHLFSADGRFLWWIVAVVWAIAAFRFFRGET